MMTWPKVTAYKDGDPVDAEHDNTAIRQLAQRTEYLREQLGTGGNKLVLSGVTLDTVNTPVLGDVVYIASTGEAAPALAEVDPATDLPSVRAMPVGVLVSIDGAAGDIVLSGACAPVGIAAADMLEEGLEASVEYKAVWLSASQPGKVCYSPSSVSSRIGTLNIDNGLLVNIGDADTAHRHSAFRIDSKLAGQLRDDGTVSGLYTDTDDLVVDDVQGWTGTHTGSDGSAYLDTGSLGAVFSPTTGFTGLELVKNPGTGYEEVGVVCDPPELVPAAPNRLYTAGDVLSWDTGDTWLLRPRCSLRVVGSAVGTSDTAYTLTLVNGGGTPSRFEHYPVGYSFYDVWMHWSSSDPEEGSGLSRVTSYERPLAIGTKGLSVVLINEADAVIPGTGWDLCESAHDEMSRRQWTLTLPSDGCGWSTRMHRSIAQPDTALDGLPELLCFGTPVNAPGKLITQIGVFKSALAFIDYTEQPPEGGIVVVNGTSYKFSADGASSGIYVGVAIAPTADISYANLVQAVSARIGVKCGLATGRVVFSAAVTCTYADVTPVATSDSLSTGITLAAFDDNGIALFESGYVSGIRKYVPCDLGNGLRIMFTDYNSDGAVADPTVINTSWSITVVDEAPGAAYEYSTGLDAALRAVWPPMPAALSSLVVDGAEARSLSLYPESPEWHAGLQGLYWWTSAYGREVLDVPVTLYTLRNRGFVGLSTSVTSITAATGSGLVFKDRVTGQTASAGDLEAGINLALSVSDQGLMDGKAVKSALGSTLLSGPVVSRIRVAPGLSVTTLPGQASGTGDVLLARTDPRLAGVFAPITLRSATNAFQGMFPYILMPAQGAAGGVTAQLHIPYELDSDVGYALRFYITLFGLADVALGGDAPYAGLQLRCSSIRPYITVDDVRGTTAELYAPAVPRGTLLSDVIEDELHLDLKIGSDDGHDYTDGSSLEPKIYGAYDPFILHNDPAMVNADGRALYVDFKVPATATGAQLAAYAGMMISLELNREAYSGAGTEYMDGIGILSMRYRLEAL